MTRNLNKKPRNFFAEWHVRELEKADDVLTIEKLLKSVTQRVFLKSDHTNGADQSHY